MAFSSGHHTVMQPAKVSAWRRAGLRFSSRLVLLQQIFFWQRKRRRCIGPILHILPEHREDLFWSRATGLIIETRPIESECGGAWVLGSRRCQVSTIQSRECRICTDTNTYNSYSAFVLLGRTRHSKKLNRACQLDVRTSSAVAHPQASAEVGTRTGDTEPALERRALRRQFLALFFFWQCLRSHVPCAV